MVCDALFTDFDNDGWPDLVLAGEWMPLTFLKNEKGVFKNVTAETGMADQVGWWNSIAPGDFDNDGDIDYVIGNLGQNSFYKASQKYLFPFMRKILITMKVMMPLFPYIFRRARNSLQKKNSLHI